MRWINQEIHGQKCCANTSYLTSRCWKSRETLHWTTSSVWYFILNLNLKRIGEIRNQILQNLMVISIIYSNLVQARVKRRATAVPNSIDRIKFDSSTAVARYLKPSRATEGVANDTSKNVGLGKFCPDLEISEAFMISLESSFFDGLFLLFWVSKLFTKESRARISN